MFTSIINILLFATILQSNQIQTSSLKNVYVTQGMHSNKIIVEWDSIENASYVLMRSQFKTGEFAIVSQTTESKYEDLSVEKGVKYWYKVIPQIDTTISNGLLITDDEYNLVSELEYKELKSDKIDSGKDDPAKKDSGKIESDAGVNGESVKSPVGYSGYTSIENPVGVKLAALMKLKKMKLQTPVNAAEKKMQIKHLNYIKEFYMNPIKLTLFMNMAGPYLDRGELVIFTDSDTFEIRDELHQVVFIDKNYSNMIVFESKKFIKILSGSGEQKLADILLKNSELFCISGGKTFIVDPKGITRLVNVSNAVGLSTRYLKNDVEWRSRTIMLATSRSDLKEKLKNASKSGVEE